MASRPDVKYICIQFALPNMAHHHPSNSPKPTFRFFLASCTPLSPTSPSNGLLGLRYFPTPPPAAPTLNAAFPVPTFTPNQLMSSPSFFSGTRDFVVSSASARLASFLAKRFLYA